MNRGQKEAYKRDYAQAKSEGKPFFPYAVYKDLVIATIAIGIVVGLAIWQRVEVGEPVNPASTDFVPRPEWYFFFLFELLRIFKNQNPLQPVIMATFIIPNIMMAILILLPFIDRGPERRPHRRPIAMVTAALVIFSLAYLTQLGAEAPAGGAGEVEITGLDPDAEAGLALFTVNGCTSCHMLKESGAPGPGPDLTDYGNRSAGVEQTMQIILEGPGVMPPFERLSEQERRQLAILLDGMGTKYK